MFFKNLIAYSGASLLAQFGQVAQSLLVRRFLVPVLLGTWNRVGVIQGFVATFDLGITQAAGRELPLLRGAGNDLEEQRVRSTACWARLGQGIVFAIGVLVFAAVVGPAESRAARLEPAAVAALLIVILSWTDAITVFCQSAQCYVPIGRTIVAAACCGVLLVPAAAHYAGLGGMMAAVVALAVFQAVLLTCLARAAGIRVSPVYDSLIARRLITFGLPLRLVDYPLTLFMVLDGVFVARFFPVAQLALYATAQIIFAAASDIPARMGNVLLSRIYVLSGGRTDRAHLARELRRYFIFQHALLMPLLLTTLWCAAQYVLPAFLPAYVPALGIARVLLLGIFFTPPNTLIRNFWILDKKLSALLASNLAGLAAGAAALLVAVRFAPTRLDWISWAMVCGYAIHFLVLLCSVGRALWGAGGAATVGLWALGGSLYVGLLLPHLQREAGASGGEGLLLGALLSWAKAQLYMAPLYTLGIWKGSAFQFLSPLFSRWRLAVRTS